MVPVISVDKWEQWCSAKHLPVNMARFALDTCYYGLGLRSRPGTIIVLDSELIHYSYSWRDTAWAIFEPSIHITIPLASISEVRQLRLGFWLKFLQASPESAFRLVTRDGAAHDFVLQRNTEEFVQALRALGFTITDAR